MGEQEGAAGTTRRGVVSATNWPNTVCQCRRRLRQRWREAMQCMHMPYGMTRRVS